MIAKPEIREEDRGTVAAAAGGIALGIVILWLMFRPKPEEHGLDEQDYYTTTIRIDAERQPYAWLRRVPYWMEPLELEQVIRDMGHMVMVVIQGAFGGGEIVDATVVGQRDGTLNMQTGIRNRVYEIEWGIRLARP